MTTQALLAERPLANPGSSAAAIEHHYDVGNDFFELWLDKAMTYSCAVYPEEGLDLDEAQRRKLDRHLTNCSARGFVTMSMSSARSTTAPCPANKLLPGPGATIARVTPAARLTATGEPIGLSAGAMSSPAEKRDRLAERSLLPATESTSTSPTRLNAATMPGVT